MQAGSVRGWSSLLWVLVDKQHKSNGLHTQRCPVLSVCFILRFLPVADWTVRRMSGQKGAAYKRLAGGFFHRRKEELNLVLKMCEKGHLGCLTTDGSKHRFRFKELL